MAASGRHRGGRGNASGGPRPPRLPALKADAPRYLFNPAKRLFALGVGHVRRRGLEPGSKADLPAEVTEITVTTLKNMRV